MLQEATEEWQMPLYFAAVDFKKAFDSVTHSSIWSALQNQGVPPCYIDVLAKLYQKQSGAVKTDRTSKTFSIQRGVKQGDPLSSLLFNAVSEAVLRKAKSKWRASSIGVPVSHVGERLTNLRFADDLLLAATSFTHIKTMIVALRTEAAEVGLQLHPDKTKILCNGFPVSRRRKLD
eukprot:962425-Pyramimonas_sp.AAC.1